jgi:hypothetical protein
VLDVYDVRPKTPRWRKSWTVFSSMLANLQFTEYDQPLAFFSVRLLAMGNGLIKL